MCQQNEKEMSNTINISNIVVKNETEQTTKLTLICNGKEYWAEIISFKNSPKKYVKQMKLWDSSKNAPSKFRNELESIINEGC